MSYLQLLQNFPPRPIRTEQEFRATQEVIDDLIDQKVMNDDQRDYLCLLGLLIEDYEDRIGVPTPGESDGNN